MNVRFSGNNLYKGFNLVASIVPTSVIKQILQGVKLEIRQGHAELTASDLEVIAKYLLPVTECEGEGGIVLPATRVNNILREWSQNDEVSMSIDEHHCTLRSKGGNFKIIGEDYLQFPVISKTDVAHSVEIDSEIIGGMVDKVAYAVSTLKVKTKYSGVFLKITGNDIIMVGSDRNRVAVIKRKVNNPQNISMSGIVTVKCLNFLQRFVSECKGVLKVGIGESQIRFVGERGEIVSQLIEGQYPDYEEVIPRQNEKKVAVNKDEFLSIVKMASFITNEEYRIIEFVLTNGKLSLSSRAANVGEAELEIPAIYEGPEYKNSFNPDYILDFLKSADTEMISIELGGPSDAALFKTGHEQFNIMAPLQFKDIPNTNKVNP